MKTDEYESLIKNLPSCPGILGRDEYFRSAVLVALTVRDGEYHFVFEVRAGGIRQGGEVSFPGGAFDSDEDLDTEQTAVRETMEELGIRRELIQIDGRLDTLVTPYGACVDVYIGRIFENSPEDYSPNPDEVYKIFTVPVSFFRKHPPEIYSVRVRIHPSWADREGGHMDLLPSEKLGLPERYKSPWDGGMHPVLFYRTEPTPVWGLTARIVREVVKLLDGD